MMLEPVFTEPELEIIDDALRFTHACLDTESVTLFKDMSVLIVKVSVLLFLAILKLSDVLQNDD